MMRAMKKLFTSSAFTVALFALAGTAAAQTASNACGYNAGNEYPVGTSCSGSAFNKPTTFTLTYTPTGCSASNNDDAWGWFTATGYTTIITYTPSSGNPILHLFTGACGSLTQLACANNGGNGAAETITYTTTPGVNYMVRMQANGTNNALNGNICIYTPAAPANDNPCGATSLSLNTSCSNTSTTSLYASATTSVPDPPCGNYGGRDVWYSFVANANRSVRIRTAANGMTDSGVALYEATSCSTGFNLLGCSANGNGNMGELGVGNLTNGATYYVRVWGEGLQQGTFNICLISVAGDEPCAATSLSVGTSCSNTSGTIVNATPSSGVADPPCGNYQGGDVWFSFVAPTGGGVTVRSVANGLTDSGIALYSASACGSGFTLISCSANGNGNMGQISQGGLTPGTTYYVRVWGENGASGTFNMCVVGVTNDSPCTATSLSVNTSCSNTGSTNLYASTSPEVPAPPCGNFQGGDVWFSFVAPAGGGVTVRSTANGLTDSGIAFYSASACGSSFTLLSCSASGNGNMGEISQGGLTPGATYYVRVWGENGASGTFNMCVVGVANDGPCTATSLSVNTACSNTGSTNAFASGTSEVADPPCGNYQGGDVWFTFVAPANGAVTVRTSSNGLTNSAVAIYSATACNGTFTLLDCAADGNGNMGQLQEYGLTPGTTYYVRVWGDNGANGTFNICVSTPILINDDPCGAIDLALTSNCNFSSYTNVNATATSGIPAPGCGNYSGGDVWFRFTATASALVTIRATAGSLTNASMALYQASACNGTFTLIACDNTSGPGNMPFLSMTPLELIPGTTYYLRVWGNGGNTGTFNLCANTAPTGTSCVYALRMYDSQGDGWGGSTVSVQVGAGAPVNYTITTGDQETAYIPVNVGQAIQLSYTAAGGAQGEIRYVLQLGYGAAYADGPTPGTGLRYVAIADCQSAAPNTSDCYGRTAVCGAQQISDNPTNTGLTAELNQHNRGCLGSNERQGSWYSFTIATGGTLAFTIAPTNTSDDYDFAVWGPFAGVSCPPIATPYRCNYSGTTGNTGLSTTASNASEGAGGSKWSIAMPVVAGETYLLYISNFSQSGLAFNLSWQLTNGASIDCTLLPVELLSFEGEAVNAEVELSWSTASENNSSHYVVERMQADGSYASIGSVPAIGNSTNTTHYSLVDPAPLPGTNLYRLRAVDQDGSSTTSDVVAVTFRAASGVLRAFPNPTEGDLNIDIDVMHDGSHYLRIMDASGRLVRVVQQSFAAGPQRFTAWVGDLAAGPYEMVLEAPDGTVLQTGRVMKH
jgi:hypothetical protein